MKRPCCRRQPKVQRQGVPLAASCAGAIDSEGQHPIIVAPNPAHLFGNSLLNVAPEAFLLHLDHEIADPHLPIDRRSGIHRGYRNVVIMDVSVYAHGDDIDNVCRLSSAARIVPAKAKTNTAASTL